MSLSNDSEVQAVVLSRSDTRLLAGQTNNEVTSDSIWRLSANMPIETGTIEVSCNSSSCHLLACTVDPPMEIATIAICLGSYGQSNRVGEIHGSSVGACQN